MTTTRTSADAQVITDIQSPYIAELTPEEQEYYKKLDKQKKARFIYMNHDTKKLLMSGDLSEDDAKLVWEHGSKLAFQYSNSGVKQKRLINDVFKHLVNGCVALAVVCFGFDLYFNIYAKNRQLNLESLDVGGQKYELHPIEIRKINGHNGLLSPESLPSNVMSLEEYKNHLMKPNFECHSLDKLSDDFKTKDGLPKCKTNPLGDRYVVGYAKQTNYPEIIMSVLHDGKIYNLDIDSQSGVGTIKIGGADSVTFERISNSFASAFPEMVRDYKANAVTRMREE